MTEKEKMLSGALYQPSDRILSAERCKARDMAFELNNILPSKLKKRKEMIKKLFGSVGRRYNVVPPFSCDYGYNIHVGDNFFANNNCTMLDGGGVYIGNNVFIAPWVGIYTVGHPLDVKTRNKGLEYTKPVKIEDNVWIGARVTILPGVTIGRNTVVGAGSVVTKSLPDNVIAFGNPCRVIRRIKNEE